MPSQLIALLNGVSTGRDSYVKNYEDGSLTRFYTKIYPELKIQSRTTENQNQELEAIKQELATLKQIINDAGLTKTVNKQGQITKLEELGLSDAALEDLIRIIRKDREKQE